MSLLDLCDTLAFAKSSGKKSFLVVVWNNIYEWAQTLVYVGTFYLVCTVFLVEGYQIPSSSMEPTFHGDTNIFKGDRIFAIKGISYFFPPKRGEIVIFVSVEDQTTFIVKRLVGMPGEKIEIRKGRLYINGTLLEDPPIFKDLRYWLPRTEYEGRKINLMTWKTPYDGSSPDLNVQRMGRFFDRPKMCFGQYYPEFSEKVSDFSYQIPEDAYFVMGDNSQASHDGRYWGALPKRNLLGKANIIWWPISRAEILHSGLPTKSFLKNKRSELSYEDE